MVGAGGLVHAPGLAVTPLTGVSFRESNGFLSLAISSLLTTVLANAAPVRISNVKQTTTQVSTPTLTGGTTTTTTTTTTADVQVLRTREQMDRDAEQMSRGADGITFLDLTVYADAFLGWDRGTRGGDGYEFAIGWHGELFDLGRLPVVLEVGLHLANIRVARSSLGTGQPLVSWASGGVVARVLVPVTRFATVSLEWVLNALSIEYLSRRESELLSEGRLVSSPLKLGVELHLTDRAFLRGQAVLGGLGFTDGRLGLFATAGVRL